jgi:3''-phosphoadenosine 5''-phosphosulfate sulfotransferase (PAPS reductase)/FAD synthetase and related enzymes
MISQLIKEADRAAKDALQSASTPAILFSGGKESMVLHALFPELVHLFFHDEIQPHRFHFLEHIYLQSPFHLLNFRPAGRGTVPVENGVDLVGLYDLRGQALLQVAISTTHSDDYCAVDWLALPVRDCPEFCFDLLIAGGKRTDHHDFYGAPFEPDRHLGSIRLLNPLYEWTDRDVWAAIEYLDIPYDRARYEQGSLTHVDSLACCTRCILAEGDVLCPKSGTMIAGQKKGGRHLTAIHSK